MLVGLALLSMPVPQQSSAQCGDEKGNPEKGAQVQKCDDGGKKCIIVIDAHGVPRHVRNCDIG